MCFSPLFKTTEEEVDGDYNQHKGKRNYLITDTSFAASLLAFCSGKINVTSLFGFNAISPSILGLVEVPAIVMFALVEAKPYT